VTNIPLSCDDCLEILGAYTLGFHRVYPGLCRECFYRYNYHNKQRRFPL